MDLMYSGQFKRVDAAIRPLALAVLHYAAILFLLPSQDAAFAQRPIKPVPPATSSAAARNLPANDIQTLFTKAQTAIDQNRLDEAMTIYNRIASLPSVPAADAAVAQARIGKIFMIQRKFELAVAAFQRSLKLNPSDAVVQNNLGEALGELKQYARALEAFTKAASLDSGLLRARYNQGVTYTRMGNTRYAEFMFRNLIKNNPTYSLGYDGLAVTLSRSGRAKEAIPFHEKAITINPNDPSFYYNLALSYLMLGNTNKALEQQEKLKKLDPMIADRLASVIVKHQM